MGTPFDFRVPAMDGDSGVIFCLDTDLRITYCNPAWDRFAQENGGSQLVLPRPIGSCVLDYISGPSREYYAKLYARLLNGSEAWEQKYECSSPKVYRKFHLRIVPMEPKPGLFVMNFLEVEREHDGATAAPVEELYRTADGLIPMCAGCRRTRRSVDRVQTWDWVPEFVETMPINVTHGICPSCAALYYRDLE